MERKEMNLEMLYTDSINELKAGIIPAISNKNLFYIIEEQGVSILENVSAQEIYKRWEDYQWEEINNWEYNKSVLPF